jgi:hypothetical protein
MTDTSLAFVAGQSLPWPGKLRLRGQIAAREADEMSQQLARARLSVAASVRRAYYGLLEARAIEGLTREQADVWRHIEGVARARYSVGQGNQQDVLRTQVELTRVGQVLAEQAANAAVREAEINRLLDRPAGTPLETAAILAGGEPAPPLDAEMERIGALSPERAAAALALDRARLAVLLAKKEYRPDFGVQGGYMNRGGLDPMWQAGITMNLPLDRKRRDRAVAAAEALVAEARAAAALARARLDETRLMSPVSGLVLHKNMEVGETASPGASILTLVDPGDVWLRAYVSETEVARLRIGQPASITVDAFAGRRFEGTVSEIASAAEFTPKNVQTKKERVNLVFRIKIAAKNPAGLLKPGMPADAEIALP